MSTVRATRKGALAVVALLAFAAAPVLILTGSFVVAANPCWFKQFPPEYCTPTMSSPSRLGVRLIMTRLGVIVALGVLAMVARATRKDGAS
jgi:hypothetical protein